MVVILWGPRPFKFATDAIGIQAPTISSWSWSEELAVVVVAVVAVVVVSSSSLDENSGDLESSCNGS